MFNAPYLFCLYAEDVRQEMNGQMSIIGVFQGGLRIPSVPAHLPKLAIIANLRIPPDKTPESVKLEVHLGSEIVQTINPPREFLQTISQTPDQGVEEGYTMQFIVGFSGFPVSAAGKLEVCATVDGLTFHGNSLTITVGDVATPPDKA